MSLKKDPLIEAIKNIKPLKKQKCQKFQRLTHFFNKQLYMHNKFIFQKWINRSHFLIYQKNLKKLGLAGELISAYLYYMIIFSFQSQFMVYQLVKQWLAIVNSVLIVVSNYLTTVKDCLTICFSKNYVLLGRSPLDEAKTSKELLKNQKY